MRRLVATTAVVLVTGASLVGCGGSSKPSGPLGTLVIDITVSDGNVTPNGVDMDVAVGQRIELRVKADVPGEIHVHSSPDEQEFEYDHGSSTIEVTPMEQPGQVAIESHTLDKTIVVLQVR
jgi:hypothetical protein